MAHDVDDSFTNLIHIFIGITSNWKQTLGDRTLLVFARCSDDLAAEHYRMAHAWLVAHYSDDLVAAIR